MKVKLAAQVFSSSVGKALQHLSKSGHPKFAVAGLTASFVIVVGQAFDFLNCGRPFGRSFKTPTTASNCK